jgi:kilA-N domain
MNVLHYIYNGKTIDFSLVDNNIMINATQMAAAFDKRVNNFLRNETTQFYIKALEKHFTKMNNLPQNGGRLGQNEGENTPILTHFVGQITENEGENIPILPPNGGRIIDYRGRNGVFFERRLALKFAAWLDVEFEIWIYTTIDRLLLGHFRELKEATTEKLLAQQALENKRKELLRKHPNDFAEFLAIENKLNLSNKRRARALKESLNALQLELF